MNSAKDIAGSTEVPELRILLAAYPLAARWATTSTDGSGLVQGQPTTLRWSLPANGVATDDNPGDPNPGAPNNLLTFLDAQWGAGDGGTDLTQRPWFKYFNESLERFESLSGLTYSYLAADDGAPITTSNIGVAGVRGDIRIAGRSIDGDVGANIGAFNSFPGLGGDMTIDTDNVSYRAFTENDHRLFRNVLMHEFGHGIGLDHVRSTDSDFLMEASPAVFDIEGPQLADILGMQRLYGDATEKQGGDVFSSAFDFGTIGGGSSAEIGQLGDSKVVTMSQTDFVSIDDETDVDFYRFTVNAAGPVSLSVTPRGATFLQGGDGFGGNNYAETSFNAKAQNDLALTLLDSDGTTILASQNTTGAGGIESIQNFMVSRPGTYYVRVSGSTANRTQLYGLRVDVAPVSGGQIFGTVFDDINGNGVQDFGETGQSGATVFLEVNSVETSVSADSQGRYSFTGLSAGSYRVRQNATTGRRFTGPQDGQYTFDLAQDEIRMPLDFGNQFVGGTAGNDAFAITYSSSTFDVTVSIDGNPAISLGTFPMSEPFTLHGNGGNDSVRIIGTAGDDDFIVTTSGLTINNSSLILDGVSSRAIEGRNGHDRYAFDADAPLGAYRLVENVNEGFDFLDFSSSSAGVTLNMMAITAQVINANLTLTLNTNNTFEDLAGGAGPDNLAGNNLPNMIVGNGDRDSIAGVGGDDNLQGGAGDDRYRFDADTNLGEDRLTELVNAGYDILVFAGTVSDIRVNLGITAQQTVNGNLKLLLNAGNSFDDVEGGAGNDTLVGNALVNYMYGQQGNDVLIGLSGEDLLSGGSGDDRFVFDADAALDTDTIQDLSGVDTFDFSSTTAAISVNLSTTVTQTINSKHKLLLAEANRIENVIGGAGADTLIGNSLNNTLTGGPGDDKLNGGVGNDLLAGGRDNDSYLFSAATAAEADKVSENTNEGTDTLNFAALTAGVALHLGSALQQTVHTNRTLQLNSPNTFENLTGGSAADTLTGNGANNTLTGGPGDDRLFGGAGSDLLAGGRDNDSYLFTTATTAEADRVNENTNEGTDSLNFAALSTSVALHLGSTLAQTVHTNRTLQLNSPNTFENLTGGSAADTLTGNGANNTLTGGPGEDRLYGGAGGDLLAGGQNNDSYLFAAATTAEADRVSENTNEGTDTLNFSALATSIALNLGSTVTQTVHTNRTLVLNSTATFENVVGGTADDTFIGNALPNRLTGGNGNNILAGLDGADILEAGSGRDLLIGGLGLDTLNGGTNDDILVAGRTTSDTNLTALSTVRSAWTSADNYATRIGKLRAGVGNPLVSLKAKNNVLNDAGEDDILTGGSGTDWYFRAVDDTITDLFAGETIDVL
ncbi:MAG: SdrD B-like domain-containing protein [Planctomycetaceae bacterium]